MESGEDQEGGDCLLFAEVCPGLSGSGGGGEMNRDYLSVGIYT